MDRLLDCENCPLNGRTKVYGTSSVGHPRLVLVGEGPGVNEEIEGVPFVGASGRLLFGILRGLGIAREDCVTTNACLCRPKPGDKLSPKEWAQALKCCHPRLEAELEGFEEVPKVALGAKALKALTGKGKITPWVGAPLDSPYGVVMPVPHPAFCLRKPSYMPLLERWLTRTLYLDRFHRIDQVADLFVEVGPQMDRALELLLGRALEGQPIGVDVETAGVDPMHDYLLCVGVASERTAVSVPWPCPDPYIEHKLRKILVAGKLVFHNGQHDVLSLEAAGFVFDHDYYFDTLLAHATVASQLPHDLGLVCAAELFHERWKSEFRVESDLKGAEQFTSRPAHELRTYNAKDALMTSWLVAPLQRALDAMYNGWELFYEFMDLNQIAIRMRRIGVQVDPSKFDHHRQTLTARVEASRARFEQLAPNVNLGKAGMSIALKNLFFKRYKMRPKRYSLETGEPSLDALTLESFIREGGPICGETARVVLDIRKYYKLLSVYIEGLPLDENHVVHPTWKIYGTVTGRWSSQDPNAQNIPKVMRDLYVPRVGLHMVKADYSQLEYRIIAYKYGITKFIRWYEQGIDAHAQNAALLFGEEWDRAGPEERKELRKIAKGATYCYFYGGDAETAWAQAVVKNPKARLPLYRQMYRKLDKLYPEVKQKQEELLRKAADEGYVEETMSGRREYFHDGRIDANKVLNFPIQAMAGTIMNRAIIGLDEELEWGKEAILFQVHDELVIEGPDKKRLVALLKKHMEAPVEVAGQEVVFPVDVESGPNWYEMEEVKC